ncbi:MAG: DUF3048 domain-containing protein [Candidatus Saccharimonadales bacterium]
MDFKNKKVDDILPPKQVTFKTPETVAAEEAVANNHDLESATPIVTKPAQPKKDWRSKFKDLWPPSRKEILIGLVVLLLLGALGYWLYPDKPKPIAKISHKPIVKVVAPKLVPSSLSGLPVDPSINAKPVTAVMIENSLDARPQSGLSQASVVFEAIAEGGITRFLTLFQDTSPDNIGPIRSARPYYVQWALGFDAAYAHVGGSPEALSDIKNWGVKDLDQFANSGSYHRVSSRAAPHNVYTAVATLNQLEASKGYNTSTFSGFTRKLAAPSSAPTAKMIDFAISSPLYNVHYDYVAATNSYNRSEGGAAHTDANGSTQISPKVVVGLVMPYGLEADDHHSQYGTIGSGPAYIFQDGLVTVGQWAKTSEKSQFTFTDSAGQPLGLNPGQTWLTALASTTNIKSSP